MTPRRILAVAVIALSAAIMPVTVDLEAAPGLKLSTAACDDGGCGALAFLDCWCPDMQFPNLRPRCDE